jgi:hypothetical protein
MATCRLDPDYECDGCENQAIPCCAGRAEQAEETPLGEELDGMHEEPEIDPWAEEDAGDMYPPEDDEISQGRYDDDPNPYSGE